MRRHEVPQGCSTQYTSGGSSPFEVREHGLQGLAELDPGRTDHLFGHHRRGELPAPGGADDRHGGDVEEPHGR
eukprot:6912197-Pyramimonas_sp.AAC.1